MIELRSQTPKGRRARTQISGAAEELLVERGFHGTSMRDVAAAADLPLATCVYHFARKEQLYRAVLDDIGAELVAWLDALPTAETVTAFVDLMLRWARERPGRVRLLLRELLDNPARVERASHLPLASFLERATALIAAGQRAGVLAPQAPELAVLHLVGALSYVVAAHPTVARIVGRARARELDRAYRSDAMACARRILGFVEQPRGSRKRSRATTTGHA